MPSFGAAMGAALLVVLVALVALAWTRHRFFDVPFRSSPASVALGGVLIAAVSAGIGGALGQSTSK